MYGTYKARKAVNTLARYDRFIPDRSAMDLRTVSVTLRNNENQKSPLDAAGLAYQYEVAKACGLALDKRILAFHEEPPVNQKDDFRARLNRPLRPNTAAPCRRRIPTNPDRVLDAPGLLDDFYLNLLDWSATNVLAVGLGNAVYLWNASTGSVSELCTLHDDDAVASLAWCHDGSYLAVGGHIGDTQIWDIGRSAKIRTLGDAASRIGSLSWNKHILSTGCRDGNIYHNDVRIAQARTAELQGHSGDVCGLKWSPDGAQLGSGGNDNLVNIWDVRNTQPKFTKQDHSAAVKVSHLRKPLLLTNQINRRWLGVHGKPICLLQEVALMTGKFVSGIPPQDQSLTLSPPIHKSLDSFGLKITKSSFLLMAFRRIS